MNSYYDDQNSRLLDIEIGLLLEGVYQKYGYDFREYSKAHVRRRVLSRLKISGIETVIGLLDRLLRDADFFRGFLNDLSINVTEMFRDPEFYRSFRENVIPKLRTYTFIKIWHAGCSTGEEVYSLAILLQEEGLLDRCQVYATDFNGKVLDIAREAVYQKSEIEQYEQNYRQAGGTRKLSDYYQSLYGSVMFKKELSARIVFADHNLVTDSVFAEVNLILCRNVLIYFEKDLQNKVLGLFHESLTPAGVLCLGSKESIRFSKYEDRFTAIDEKQRIFKKRLI
ncbi:protein-glutamate O-methyltransferase CheR [Mangrovibacterium marinum]|uniref:Chemotaxis protein methyltransferase CheR n=1 Tax=Mangrovibacterium marinum TaxID=1639118 RepID=A0A2T5C4J2_9BACT|nr:protein-glutamate O-methyltransferase CheR [Mangrovibacterium marinum]PTN09790.1 chemotaxis protein methyltransferase CheR [Mangrovibacterium marinum]